LAQEWIANLKMRREEFTSKYNREIRESFTSITRRYSVTEAEYEQALAQTAEKYLFKGAATVVDKDIKSFISQINAPDLYFALACAKGDDAAWNDFMGEYRGFLQGIARQLTNNETLAEELVEVAWTELYGLRELAGKRISKFSSYSGRGSLKGWLRAVLFQLSVDRHRRQGRFVQPEEDRELERLSPVVPPPSEHTGIGDQYRAATHKSLEKALSQLDSKLKMILGYYYYDNLTLKQIGQLFGVHEATASRWLQRAQQDIRQAVEKLLKQDYKFNAIQIKECLEFAAESDVDVRGLLVETEPPAIDRGS
jgi:RNA polymerase sigma-70 factor